MEELIKEFEEKEGLYAYFESVSGVIEYNSHFVEWMAEQLRLGAVSNRRKLLRDYEMFTVPEQNMEDVEQNISWFLGE